MDPEEYEEEAERLTDDVMEQIDGARSERAVIRTTIEEMIPVLVSHGWEPPGGSGAERAHDPGDELPPEDRTRDVRRGHDPGEEPPDDWP